ncbi:hypothetical protein AVEN_94263-1 [Araneus ventricosus]|uniref:Uncharacterized protein n=1 Tax=Araneus ventricosus TaxID=182803 RepID=A0A4Y2JN90_ARAVE|nr:hypothetical protein AVEN_94263-1 [Araneus ventricosus]
MQKNNREIHVSSDEFILNDAIFLFVARKGLMVNFALIPSEHAPLTEAIIVTGIGRALRPSTFWVAMEEDFLNYCSIKEPLLKAKGDVISFLKVCYVTSYLMRKMSFLFKPVKPSNFLIKFLIVSLIVFEKRTPKFTSSGSSEVSCTLCTAEQFCYPEMLHS